jgi:energy-coupling factor transport system permease protein
MPKLSYHAGGRGLHRAGPLGNLLLLAAFATVGIASPSLFLKLGALALIGTAAILSGETPLAFLRSLRFVVVFALVLFVAQALSIRTGTTLFSIGVPITSGGLVAGGEMALRFLVILTASFLFVLVTDPDRLAHLFIRLGIPYRYGFSLILALRFVPFFRGELRTVREAQTIRGIRPSVRSLSGLRRTIRYTFVPVLVSGLLRVDSITMSMSGRAFGLYSKRTSAEPLRIGAADAVIGVLSLGLLGLVILARRFAWP